MIACAIAACLASPGAARALDVEIDSDVSFQAYEVRAPGTRTTLLRRRLVSNLGLRLSQPLSEPEPDGRRIRLSVSGRLRLYNDFGQDCLIERELCVRANDPREPSGWQPLAQRSVLDVPALQLAIDGLPLGLEARLGRLLEHDPIGFARFDGGSVGVAPLPWIAARFWGGALVRSASVVGSPAFEPPGTHQLDRGGADPLAATWTNAPSTTWAIGATLSGGPGRYLMASASVRQAWDDHGTVVRRLGASLTSQPIPELRLEAIGVLDLLDLTPIDALAAAELRAAPVLVRAAIERHVPRFDPGSIWAWFRLAPIDEVSLSGTLSLSDDLELGGALRGRRAELGELGEDLDAGVDGWAHVRLEAIDVQLSGFVWSGSLGPVAGVSLDAARRFDEQLTLGLHASVWHFDDPLREELRGLVVSESIDAVFEVTELARIALEVAHAVSPVVGHRFRGIIWLRVQTWR